MAAKYVSLSVAFGLLTLAGCSSSTSSSSSSTPSPKADLSTKPPSPDPRVGLKAGKMDAQEAIWNLRKLSTTPPSEQFVDVTNSDLAFTGNYAIQGNHNGSQGWAITTRSKAT